MSRDPVDPAAQRRQAFGAALASTMSVRGLTQRALGELLGGVSQPAISAWLRGDSEPATATVFEIERVLELGPGRLSQLLGYLPPEAARKAPTSFEAVVSTDPLLDDAAKRGLVSLYRELTSRRSTGRGGRPRKATARK